ncbi:hypothetical protein B0H14DRAFT_3131271 [Mycena olivaceomarginata]|nr:hypothetical protein B0H14DRAFT_3131271 [Mycena olivaceomarginata]
MDSMDKLELRIVWRARCLWERSRPEDTDGLDDQMDCTYMSGGQPDRLRKDIKWTEVDQMGQADDRRMVRMNWSQGLSDGLEAREKDLDPRFGRGRGQTQMTRQIVQSRRADRSQEGTVEARHPLTISFV